LLRGKEEKSEEEKIRKNGKNKKAKDA